MKSVRLGIIGIGNMGLVHARNVSAGKVDRCELAAVCDVDPARFKDLDEKVLKFTDGVKLIESGAVDAVLIAVQHYEHTTLGIRALDRGLHVLVEKPISVHKADCERLIAAHKGGDQVFAAMFQERTNPLYMKVKELVGGGGLGDMVRFNWIVTSWFRTEYYYGLSDWRATWAGEGGGVLLNQCPHQLDLLQWICGMPVSVRGFCAFGRRHDIEVEDEVTAYMEFSNGASGVFISSTGEAPGTNRLEIAGEMGRLVVEDGKASFVRNKVSALEFIRTSRKAFDRPETENVEIQVGGGDHGHVALLRNFVAAILDGAPLIAPAREGAHSVELANAILFSALKGKPVGLPMDGRAFERLLRKLIRESKVVKRSSDSNVVADMGKSYTA